MNWYAVRLSIGHGWKTEVVQAISAEHARWKVGFLHPWAFISSVVDLGRDLPEEYR